MPTVVIGTAGHIDHGKTSLLRALTGIDADRLPEERARGMTIDVGYAHLTFDDGVELDFVDVPGHDRLIGNMLVGAGEIDAAMLVVAADDGPRPQTLEHLALLDALGIEAGLVVITKADLVDADRVASVTDAVGDLLRPTGLRGAPILTASSATGAGIAELRVALRALVVSGVAAGGPQRLAVDRVFSARGRGTVVTGSLRGGSIRVGDTLRREPGGDTVRIRELQVHGHGRDQHDGGRTALNLVGLGVEEVHRGDVLTGDPRVRATDRVLARLIGRDAVRTRALMLHVGTAQVGARLRPVRGAPAMLRIDFDRPIATFEGDRGVLREPGRGEVAGGIRMLDVAPPRGISQRRMTPERLAALAAAVESGDASPVQSARAELHGVLSAGADVLFAGDVRLELEAAALEAVGRHHAEASMSAGLPLPRARAALLRRLRSLATVERSSSEAVAAALSRLLDDLVIAGRLARAGDGLRDPGRPDAYAAPLRDAMARLEALLSVAAPPALDAAVAAAGCPPEAVRALAAEGRIIRLGPNLAWATPTYHRLAAAALDRARAAPLTPAAFRDATGTSRKFVMAILEDLDRRGILARTPEGHIPGPRAPR